MKIGYIGNFEPEWSTENDVRKAFEFLGHEVIKLQEDKCPWHVIRDLVITNSIDMLLWTSTWEFDNGGQPLAESLETLRLAALRGIPTATYHLDVFFGSDRGNRRWLINPMLFTRYIFTADGDNEDKWQAMGANHEWLRPAVRHDAAHFGKGRPEYECDVAFLGSNGIGYHENVWPYRKELVDNLREMCQRNGWSWRNPGGELEKPDAGKVQRSEDRNDFYASAKVTVGDSLCLKHEAAHYCSDRVYEATGCGGFLIMPQIDFVQEDFHGHIPMYPWGDFKALEDIVRFYLEHPEQNQEVRQKTQAIAAEFHTYVNRAQTIIEKVGLNG